MPRSSARARLAALTAISNLLRGKPPFARRQTVAWSEVVALAEELAVSSALWPAAQPQLHAIPEPVAETLRDHYRSNTIRNARLRGTLTQAVTALNDAGIVPMLFKGSLALVDGTVDRIGGRWLSDLDILVPASDLAGAERALTAIGYSADTRHPWIDYGRPLVRRGTPWPVDLHSALGSAAIVSLIPTTEAWEQSSELAVADARARALSPTHQVLHNVIHSAVQELNHQVGGLPLRHLLGLTSLVRAHGDAVDWSTIRARIRARGLERVVRDHLWLAHRFTGLTLPYPEDARALGPRLHEARVILGFAARWPVPVQKNLRQAFGREYLDSEYGHGDDPLRLATARARHAVRLVRRDGARVLDELLVRRL